MNSGRDSNPSNTDSITSTGRDIAVIEDVPMEINEPSEHSDPAHQNAEDLVRPGEEVSSLSVIPCISNLRSTGQLSLASIELIKFLCLDNCGEVFTGAPATNTHKGPPSEHRLPYSFEENGCPCTYLPDLMRPSYEPHNNVYLALQSFSHSEHSEYVCEECKTNLSEPRH